MKEEDRGPLDITLLLEQANKKIEDLKDVIDGHKSWHDSDKQQIFDLKQALGKLQNLDILNAQHKVLIAQLKRDNTLLAKQFDEQLNQFRNKGSL
jgi:hypothetical protein|tara:strand:- start:852 stop:1136 length:285 start_codon:yes stop_codon:yes gene_type:complete